MQKFDLYEEVDGMQPCRKKPIVVHAKQMNHVFCVDTLEGVMSGNPGDYLMKDINGELYPCKREIFEASFNWVNEESI
jgi:hypothetical protein